MKKGQILLKLDQGQLGLIVKHLNRGVYEEVALFLSELRGQVDSQMPKPKQMPKSAEAGRRAEAIIKSSSEAARYAKKL